MYKEIEMPQYHLMTDAQLKALWIEYLNEIGDLQLQATVTVTDTRSGATETIVMNAERIELGGTNQLLFACDSVKLYITDMEAHNDPSRTDAVIMGSGRATIRHYKIDVVYDWGKPLS